MNFRLVKFPVAIWI